MTSWLSRLRTEHPPTIQAQHYEHTPSTPRTAAKTRDPNSTDYRYQVNQKCIYERRLPGGSYITAHVQRLQSGYYDSPMVHEDLIENVRFVAISFVFHPSRNNFRFKSAQIKVAIHHEDDNHHGPFPLHDQGPNIRRDRKYENGDPRDSGIGVTSQALVRSSDTFPTPKQLARNRSLKPMRPRFLRHSPHLLYGRVSPETLNWNFNLAGQLGVTQGPANASLNPSGGVNGSYKLYEMMKIQGSVRGLHSWHGREYSVEDGEIVWTLEENRLQKSGLPREFTFVMLLTKGSGGYEDVGDVKLDLDIDPQVAGFMGFGNLSYPGLVTNLLQFQPLHSNSIDLDLELGQRFEPVKPGKGFNFADLAASFDEFVFLPGTTFSTSEHGTAEEPEKATAGGDATSGRQKQKQFKAPEHRSHQQLAPADTNNTNAINLRVFLESARGSPIPAQLPYVSLKPPFQQQQQACTNLPYPSSRGTSPLPSAPRTGIPAPQASMTGSQRSHASHNNANRRSITITSSTPRNQSQTRNQPSNTGGDQEPVDEKLQRRMSRSPTLRRRTSRSSLDREYRSSISHSPSDLRIRPFSTIESSKSRHPSDFSWRPNDDVASHATQTNTASNGVGNVHFSLDPKPNGQRNRSTSPSPNRAPLSGVSATSHASSLSRVHTKASNVSQTPYPFSPDHDTDPEAAMNAEINTNSAAIEGVVREGSPNYAVPQLSVPRKSSRRKSGDLLVAYANANGYDHTPTSLQTQNMLDGSREQVRYTYPLAQPAVVGRSAPPPAPAHQQPDLSPSPSGGGPNKAPEAPATAAAAKTTDEPDKLPKYGDEKDALQAKPKTPPVPRGGGGVSFADDPQRADIHGITTNPGTIDDDGGGAKGGPVYQNGEASRSGVYHDASETLLLPDEDAVGEGKAREKEEREREEEQEQRGQFDERNVF